MEMRLYPYAKFIFRAGFASIFLVNAIVAAVDPDGFIKLVTDNVIGQYTPDLLLPAIGWFIALNDFTLGVMILTNKYKVIVYGWAGAWLLIIAGIKIMNLIWPVG